jgi:hypothetical protein
MNKLIDTLHREQCSLVLRDKQGRVRLFWKQGVRDLEDLLDREPETLHGASIADKVVGKAAAGMMVVGKVSELYADVMSRLALPLLDVAGIGYTYGTMVDEIIMCEDDKRCPLEQIVAPAKTAEEVVEMLKAHFRDMASKKNLKQ